jgi:CAAX protease family protein
MNMLPDLLYVALFAFVGPLIDYSVFWPAYRRLSQTDPAWARRWLWKSGIANLWLLVGFGTAIWMASGRDWTGLGFNVPMGWQLWTAIAMVSLVAAYYLLAVASIARSAATRANLRRQFGGAESVVPHSRSELNWFGGVSVSAGFCEEFLFRGYFIWTFTPWLGWWGAAALSLSIFALAHVYQGWGGVLRTATFGALFTLVVAITGSLWPAIALHVLVDLAGGVMAWLVLRENAAGNSQSTGSA